MWGRQMGYGNTGHMESQKEIFGDIEGLLENQGRPVIGLLGVSGDPNSKLGGALEKDRGHKEDLVGHEVTWGNMGT